MWVIYRTSDGRIVDIQPQRGADIAGAAWVFVEGATRERLGHFYERGGIAAPPQPQPPREITPQRLLRALRSMGLHDKTDQEIEQIIEQARSL